MWVYLFVKKVFVHSLSYQFYFQESLKYVENRKHVAYKDKDRRKVYVREKRNKEGVPLSHKKLSESMKEQNKILKAFIKATTEKPRVQEEEEQGEHEEEQGEEQGEQEEEQEEQQEA